MHLLQGGGRTVHGHAEFLVDVEDQNRYAPSVVLPMEAGVVMGWRWPVEIRRRQSLGRKKASGRLGRLGLLPVLQRKGADPPAAIKVGMARGGPGSAAGGPRVGE